MTRLDIKTDGAPLTSEQAHVVTKALHANNGNPTALLQNHMHKMPRNGWRETEYAGLNDLPIDLLALALFHGYCPADQAIRSIKRTKSVTDNVTEYRVFGWYDANKDGELLARVVYPFGTLIPTLPQVQFDETVSPGVRELAAIAVEEILAENQA